MTSYEQGFLTKCAEHNLPFPMARQMLDVVLNNGGYIEKRAWGPLTWLGLGGAAAASYGSNQAAPVANTADDYSKEIAGQRNANLQPYIDKVDSGRAGTAFGRTWHGLYGGSWLDRQLGTGVRDSTQYTGDAEESRIRRASELARRDMDLQARIERAHNDAPQLDGLHVSSIGGFKPQVSANPNQVKVTDGKWGNQQQAAPARPAAAPAATAATAAAPAATAAPARPAAAPAPAARTARTAGPDTW